MGDEGYLGFDARCDKTIEGHVAAIGVSAVIAQKAEHRFGDVHLLHLGLRGKPGLEPGQTHAGAELSRANGILDGIGVVPVEAGVFVGDLGNGFALALGAREARGKLSDGRLIERHRAALARAASRRLSATSSIMSS